VKNLNEKCKIEISPNLQQKKLEEEILKNIGLQEEIDRLQKALSTSVSSEVKNELKSRLVKLEAELRRLGKENAVLKQQHSGVSLPPSERASSKGTFGVQGQRMGSTGFHHMSHFGGESAPYRLPERTSHVRPDQSRANLAVGLSLSRPEMSFQEKAGYNPHYYEHFPMK
jgi:hypothetical protein